MISDYLLTALQRNATRLLSEGDFALGSLVLEAALEIEELRGKVYEMEETIDGRHQDRN